MDFSGRGFNFFAHHERRSCEERSDEAISCHEGNACNSESRRFIRDADWR